MIVGCIFLSLVLTLVVLTVLGNHRLLALTTARSLLLSWLVLFIFYSLIAAWLILNSAGLDPNDEPYSLALRITGALCLIVSMLQIGLVIRMIRHEAKALLWTLLGLSFVLCLVVVWASGFEGMATAFPASVNLVVVAAFAVPRLWALRRIAVQ